MPIQFQCQSCRSTLRVPDNLAGRKVKCPKCAGVNDVIATPAASPSAALLQAKTNPAARPQPVADDVRIRARKPQPVPEPEIEDAEEVEDRPSRPVRSKSRREEAISTRLVRRNEPTEIEDEEVDRPQRPKLRRRKRRRRPETGSSWLGWGFVRWVAASVIYAGVASAVAIHMIATDHVGELVLAAVYWAVMMPVSLVIFFASMFIGSAIAGGIDFGDALTAIPKALFLLAPINFIYALLPGFFAFALSLPFWIGGLILLFGLDVWEAKFVILINWFLNKGAGILIFLIVISMMHGIEKAKEKDSPDDVGDDDGQIVAPIQKAPPNLKMRLRR